MATKQWNVGDVLSAADLNSWAVPLAAVKVVDTSRASTTTLANDPELSLAVAANVIYRFWAYLDYEGGTTGSSDIKWSFSVPAGATLRYQMIAVNTAGTLSPLLIGPTFTAVSTNSAAMNITVGASGNTLFSLTQARTNAKTKFCNAR